VPSPEQILALIVHADGWEGIEGSSPVEASEELDYEERKIVLKRVTGTHSTFADTAYLSKRHKETTP
jgi:hypothetical protein